MAGRPKHRPTDEQRRQVLSLTGYGIHQDEVAKLLQIAPKTLRLHYRRELDTGVTEANARVAQSLYNMAVRDKVPSAAIFWLKARAGWRDSAELSVQTTVTIGGVDRPPLLIDESDADWLERRRAELASLVSTDSNKPS
jgi:hypothetical protein